LTSVVHSFKETSSITALQHHLSTTSPLFTTRKTTHPNKSIKMRFSLIAATFVSVAAAKYTRYVVRNFRTI
jgi:hypothetical protein